MDAAPEAAAVNGAPSEERRGRRGVNSLLSAYYGILGADGTEAAAGPPVAAAAAPPQAAIDRDGFDAQAHFEELVAEGGVRDVMRHANEVDAQVKDLDGDMQMVCYENYSKFIRATEVTGLVKSSVDDMAPELGRLERSFSTISEHQRSIEDGVSGRAREIELLLKRQRRCRTLQVLFELPTTLQRCLDREAYGRACEAYCVCTPFLRQYKHVETFKRVLDAAELQMGRIKTALEWRLRSPDLSSKDALNSSATLLDLGEAPPKVCRDYLDGRAAALRSRLGACFPGGTACEDEAEAALRSACRSAASDCVPELADAVDGFNKLRQDREVAAEDFDPDTALADFVSQGVEGLCTRVAQLAERRRPPVHALVESVHMVRDSLRRLHSLMPRLLAKVFTSFLGRLTSEAGRSAFAAASAGTVAELINLHGECERFQDPRASSTLDAVLGAAARTERAIAARAAGAVADCQPLLGLIESDASACQQLVQGVKEQLAVFSGVFCEACRVAAAAGTASCGASLARAARDERPAEMETLAGLEWNGLFSLALVWLGRRIEEKVFSGAWARAGELFAGVGAGQLGADQSAGAGVLAAAEAALTQFARVGGHRLAHFLRNAMGQKSWATAQAPPAEPSLVVEMVLKEVHAFDAQLGRLLGDPRKQRGGGGHRRNFGLGRTSMELEIERQWARKVQAFAPAPFNRSGAITAILRIAFKALVEYVREEAFATYGLQQLQLDAELLGDLSRDFVETEDAAVLSSLLGEAVNSASQRCDAPTLMEATALEAICDRKKRTLRLE